MKVYLSLEHGGKAMGTLHLVLYNDQVPKTVKNFVGLLPKYKGSCFHRIIPGFMAQGGDFVNGDGTGSACIYDGNSFDDEALHLKHSRVGTLSMANSGPNTNGCQFFVTFRPTPHLNGKHVVFGHVDLEKSSAVLDALESVTVTAADDKPKRPVVIAEYALIVDKDNDEEAQARTSRLEGTAAAELDSAEINLQDDGHDDAETDQGGTGAAIKESSKVLDNEQNDDIDIESNHHLSAKDKINLRMRSLKQKINQARQLNKQAVKEEGERLSESDRDRKRQESKKDKAEKETAWNLAHQKTLELAEAAGVDARMLAQPAAESLSIAEKQAAKAKLNAFPVNDYHNPEGQYRNYERNIRSVRHNVTETDESTFNPLDAALTSNSDDRDGAHLVAAEMQRRYEKSRKRELKRKDKQDVEGSYINKRNKHFNKKISRTYDAATAEIKQNLERGTAL
jgi:cyclophilin family peptidyl-prolyl cis-trans isomerase